MNYDFAMPGTGPIKMVGPSNNSLELEKYLNFNTSMRSRNDNNLNSQPEGHVKMAISSGPENREGVYAIQTDRGDLYPTIETQVNIKGQQLFKNRLQDYVKPTTKETLLHTYEGNLDSFIKNPTSYSNILPTYITLEDGTSIRASGASDYSLRSATEHSYIPGPATTGMNNNVVQNPDVVYNNVWKRPDNNVDGPGTFKGVTPDSTRSQIYNRINDPTTNGMRLTYNLEANEAVVLGQKLPGVEERFTSAYQIAPLMSNPLHKIWNPDNKGEIPAFFTNSNPGDFSYIHQTRLPEDEYVPGETNPNSYVLSLGQGIHNDRIEWQQDINKKPGVIYNKDTAIPGKSYSGNRSIYDLYENNIDFINSGQRGPIYTTLGDPSAGFLTN